MRQLSMYFYINDSIISENQNKLPTFKQSYFD